MTSPPLITVGPNEPILNVLELLDEHAVGHVLVMEGSALLGVLSRADLMRFLELSRELGVNATLARRKSVLRPDDGAAD